MTRTRLTLKQKKMSKKNKPITRRPRGRPRKSIKKSSRTSEQDSGAELAMDLQVDSHLLEERDPNTNLLLPQNESQGFQESPSKERRSMERREGQGEEGCKATDKSRGALLMDQENMAQESRWNSESKASLLNGTPAPNKRSGGTERNASLLSPPVHEKRTSRQLAENHEESTHNPESDSTGVFSPVLSKWGSVILPNQKLIIENKQSQNHKSDLNNQNGVSKEKKKPKVKIGKKGKSGWERKKCGRQKKAPSQFSREAALLLKEDADVILIDDGSSTKIKFLIKEKVKEQVAIDNEPMEMEEEKTLQSVQNLEEFQEEEKEVKKGKKRGRKPKELKLQGSMANLTEIFNELSKVRRQPSVNLPSTISMEAPMEEEEKINEGGHDLHMKAKIIVPDSFKLRPLFNPPLPSGSRVLCQKELAVEDEEMEGESDEELTDDEVYLERHRRELDRILHQFRACSVNYLQKNRSLQGQINSEKDIDLEDQVLKGKSLEWEKEVSKEKEVEPVLFSERRSGSKEM